MRLSEVKGRLRLLPHPPPSLPQPPPPPLGATYSVSRASNLEIIALYCVVAAAARDSCTTLLPAAATDRAVKCASNCAINKVSGPREPFVLAMVVGRVVMPFPRMAAVAEPNTFARTPARRHAGAWELPCGVIS